MATRSDGSQSTSRAILVIAGILVLSALAYFAIKYFTYKADNETQKVQIDNLSLEVEELEKSIGDFRNQVNNLEVDLTTKEQLLNEKVAELENVQASLAAARRANKTQTSQIRVLEAKVQDLQTVLEDYDDIIAKLRNENQILSGQVDSLVAREGQLQTVNQELQERNTQTREELDRTVAVASTLKARGLKFFSYKAGKKEKEFTKLAKWRMKDLQICFSILENQIAPRGDRSVYISIEDASGNPITNFTDDYSGRFPYQNEDKVYSAVKTVSFFGSEIEDCVEFAFPDGTQFEKSVYYVFVYADNALIGQSSFEID
ncbi:MAG: hypothetical protein NWR72_16140 [Bacteroidia bacterium]|nr:hypothetical protein [Bacteroidia bacterium]